MKKTHPLIVISFKKNKEPFVKVSDNLEEYDFPEQEPMNMPTCLLVDEKIKKGLKRIENGFPALPVEFFEVDEEETKQWLPAPPEVRKVQEHAARIRQMKLKRSQEQQKDSKWELTSSNPFISLESSLTYEETESITSQVQEESVEFDEACYQTPPSRIFNTQHLIQCSLTDPLLTESCFTPLESRSVLSDDSYLLTPYDERSVSVVSSFIEFDSVHQSQSESSDLLLSQNEI